MTSESESSYQEFVWYKAGNWETIEQGDLVTDCPVFVPSDDLTQTLLKARLGSEVTGASHSLGFADLIVLSQTCDLLKPDLTQVLLCGHFPVRDYGKNERDSIRKEHRPALHMIEACDIIEPEFEQRVVDFRTVFTLPKDFVLAFLDSKPSRLRLMPPYREHLAQAFARYFMRIGLPRNLKNP